MTIDKGLGPDMRDLLAAVGEVLLTWGYLEHEMEQWIATICGSQVLRAATRAPIISLWRDAVARLAINDTDIWAELLADVEVVASVRNLLAHGLSAASVDLRDSKEAHVVCRARDGTRRSIALSELLETERQLHSLRRRVRELDVNR